MSMPPPIPFDARPLTQPVDPNAAKAFGRMLEEQGRIPRGANVGRIVAIVFLAVFGGGFVLFFALIGLAIATATSSSGPNGFSLLFFVPVLFIAAVFGVAVFFMARSMRGSGERLLRLDTFARANGMTYVPSIPNPHLPGMIFHLGSDRKAVDLVRGELPRFVEFGNHRYTVSSGKNQSTVSWGYVAVRLDVPLPHIVLDAVGNNAIGSNLPASFDKRQRLSLEGDFDRYFHLYCPRDYEADALYLFTPDVMARFIDNAAALDVEIVDDWLFLYSKRDLSTLDPATWAWLFSVVSAFLDKLAQWARWRDERLAASVTGSSIPRTLPDAAASGIPGATAAPAPMLLPPPQPGVAPPGQRLRRRMSWGAIVAIVVIAGWLLLIPFGGLAAVIGFLVR